MKKEYLVLFLVPYLPIQQMIAKVLENVKGIEDVVNFVAFLLKQLRQGRMRRKTIAAGCNHLKGKFSRFQSTIEYSGSCVVYRCVVIRKKILTLGSAASKCPRPFLRLGFSWEQIQGDSF